MIYVQRRGSGKYNAKVGVAVVYVFQFPGPSRVCMNFIDKKNSSSVFYTIRQQYLIRYDHKTRNGQQSIIRHQKVFTNEI